MFVMTLLAVVVLLAFAWGDLEARLPSRRVAVSAWGLAALLLAIELSGVPFSRYEVPCPSFAEELREARGVHALLEVPFFYAGAVKQARYTYCQTFHERKLPQGYVTNLAVTAGHWIASERWEKALRPKRKEKIRERMRAESIDVLILNKLAPRLPTALLPHRALLWKPFVALRGPLVEVRQRGRFVYGPIRPRTMRRLAGRLLRELGPPVHEDETAVAFRLPP
jgi:hypothetical protein